jgi:hypothetical protein
MRLNVNPTNGSSDLGLAFKVLFGKVTLLSCLLSGLNAFNEMRIERCD